MNVKAFAALTQHPAEPTRLPKEIREALPEETRAKKRIYPKDLPTDTYEELFARFWVALEPLRRSGKLGAILLQYPEWFVIGREAKQAILRARELLPDDRLAVEFRNQAWMTERNRDETLRFLRENGLAYVSVDAPQGFRSSMPPVAAATSALAVVRFHGRNAETWKKPGLSAAERFDYRYAKEELAEWVPRIRALAEDVDDVHVLMNNCYGDKAVRNAAEIATLLASSD